uniref:histidine kinase n=1 Tax=Ananas comosus var. bracteatus TaxID=296719 RepID=A0A6V7PR64_ANACO|nr:unnamed protein product [Ananas comosus var. bracteatus]
MEKLTGWPSGEVIGKLLVGEIFGSCCRLKGPDALTKFMIVLHNAIGGQETDKFPFAFFDKNGKYVQALLTANTRSKMDEAAGKEVLCQNEGIGLYLSRDQKPLSGIRFTNSLLEMTDLNDDQKQFLETSASCEKQMLKIIKDANLHSIDDGSLVLDKSVFPVGSVINAVVSQVMILLRERGLQLIRDIPEEIKEISVYGDQFRIQQVLADFLLNMVRCAPSENGWVEIQVRPNLKQNPDGTETVLLLFRFACPGEGLAPELVQDMFHNSRWATEEGLGLSICRKILKLMGGDVQYIRESERCFFLIALELPTSQKSGSRDD